MSDKTLTPRERVEQLVDEFIRVCVEGTKGDVIEVTTQLVDNSRQLAAELEEAKRRAEAAERQLARYREKYGELE